MTVLDPVIQYLLTCEKKRVTLADVMNGTDLPRRPVLRVLDKLTKDGYLKQVSDNHIMPKYGECGPPRRNPTWKIINDVKSRPKQALHKNTMRDRIWQAIRAKRHFTRLDITRTSGATRRAVDEYVLILERAGYLRRTGKDGKFITFMLIKNQVDRPIIGPAGGHHE